MADSIFDKTLKQHHRIEQRANQLAEDMAAILEASQERIVSKLAELEALMIQGAFDEETASRRKALLQAQRREVEKVLEEVYASMEQPLKEAGSDVMAYTASQTATMLAPIVGISVSEPRLETSVVEKWFEMSSVEGLLINEWLAKLEANAADRIIAAGRQAMVEAMPIGQTVRFMRKQGIQGSIPALEGLARTFCQSAAHYAKEQIIEQQFGDFTTGWQYVATLDSRTCPVCGVDDLKIYKRGEDKPELPRHWRCRCVYVPRCKYSEAYDKIYDKPFNISQDEFNDVFGKDKPLKHKLNADELNEIYKNGTRPTVYHNKRTVHHRDGSTSTDFSVDKVTFVRQSTSYQEWMQRQLKDDPAFVRSVLGKTRFELFKTGRLTLKQMTAHGKLKRLADLL